jgi:nitric oxide dioxygenase
MCCDQIHDLTVHFYNEEQTGRINKEVLKHQDRKGTYYVCGPVGFMKFVIQSLYHLGVPEEQVHHEFFGPSMKLNP